MIINSLLDTDTYKITMGQAIAHHYARVPVEYEFVNRGKTKFPDGFAQRLRHEVDAMSSLSLRKSEEEFLRTKCYYLQPWYVDVLRSYQFDPKQVNIRQVGGELFVTVSGLWYVAVMWEVPLLAIISELYYEMKNLPVVEPTGHGGEPSWDTRLRSKLSRFASSGCVVSDFGTRRRYSYAIQDSVVETLKKYSDDVILSRTVPPIGTSEVQLPLAAGTSNLHLAHKYGLTPIGTMAHEWGQGHACLYGYRMAAKMMLKKWVEVYNGHLGIVLPDTFTTSAFLSDFDTMYAKLFDGIRHDSGNWKWFTDMVVAHYEKLRIDPATKTIVYSDALTTDQVLEIQKYAQGRILPRFGIGTHLTNDVGQKPLNIVIKMTKCDGRDAIKLSDSPGKAMGNSEAISACKHSLGIQ